MTRAPLCSSALVKANPPTSSVAEQQRSFQVISVRWAKGLHRLAPRVPPPPDVPVGRATTGCAGRSGPVVDGRASRRRGGGPARSLQAAGFRGWV